MAERTAPRFAVTADAPSIDIAQPLLAYLRAAHTPTLAYENEPTPILGGFDTLIYTFTLRNAPASFSGPLIIRIFRDEGGTDRARYETTVQNAVASLGYPAPRVLDVCEHHDEIDGAFLIMERMPGRIMLEPLIGPKFFGMAALLGATHARLHDLDVEAFRRSIGDARDPRGVGTLDDLMVLLERAAIDGLRPALSWLKEHRLPAGRASICHGDFHPLNVLVEGNAISGVVDWGWAAVTDPAFDVGATVALLTQGPVDLPSFLQPIVRRLRSVMVSRYLRAYRERRAIDEDAVRYYEALRLVLFLAEEWDNSADAVRRPGRSPFEGADVQRRIAGRFQQITGVALSLPA